MPDQAPSPIPAYVAGLLRNALASIAGFLVAKGYITADQAPELIGGAIVIVTASWSWIRTKNAHHDLKVAIAAPAGKAQ